MGTSVIMPESYAESNSARVLLQQSWTDYVCSLASWRSMFTGTYRDEIVTSRSMVEYHWRRLVQYLNVDLFGKRYTQTVHHSYFAYAAAFEHTTRYVWHIHVLIDRPVNFELVHSIWNKWAGFAEIKRVDDNERAARYVSKYATKGGDLLLYKPSKYKEPPFKPLWYLAGLRDSDPRRSADAQAAV